MPFHTLFGMFVFIHSFIHSNSNVWSCECVCAWETLSLSRSLAIVFMKRMNLCLIEQYTFLFWLLTSLYLSSDHKENSHLSLSRATSFSSSRSLSRSFARPTGKSLSVCSHLTTLPFFSYFFFIFLIKMQSQRLQAQIHNIFHSVYFFFFSSFFFLVYVHIRNTMNDRNAK